MEHQSQDQGCKRYSVAVGADQKVFCVVDKLNHLAGGSPCDSPAHLGSSRSCESSALLDFRAEALEVVGCFKMLWGRVDVKNPASCNLRNSEYPQILSHQGLEEDHAARSIGKDVEELHAYAVGMVENLEGLGSYGRYPQALAGNTLVGVDRESSLDGIQIVPENALADDCGETGESLDREGQSHLQYLRDYIRLEIAAETENRHLAELHRDGVYLRGIVQRIPGKCLMGIEAPEVVGREPFCGLRNSQTRVNKIDEGKLCIPENQLLFRGGQLEVLLVCIQELPENPAVFLG